MLDGTDWTGGNSRQAESLVPRLGKGLGSTWGQVRSGPAWAWACQFGLRGVVLQGQGADQWGVGSYSDAGQPTGLAALRFRSFALPRVGWIRGLQLGR